MSKKNQGVPEAQLLVNPEHREGNYVMINKNLTAEQIKSISESFAHIQTENKQLYLMNNRISGKSFELLLRSLSPQQ